MSLLKRPTRLKKKKHAEIGSDERKIKDENRKDKEGRAQEAAGAPLCVCLFED